MYVFEKEEWKIVRSEKAVSYGGVPNRVAVFNALEANSEDYEVLIAVPTALFHFLKNVFHLEDGKGCTLFLEEIDTKWSFGINLSDGASVIDLWQYKILPPWAERRYRVS